MVDTFADECPACGEPSEADGGQYSGGFCKRCKYDDAEVETFGPIDADWEG